MKINNGVLEWDLGKVPSCHQFLIIFNDFSEAHEISVAETSSYALVPEYQTSDIQNQ